MTFSENLLASAAEKPLANADSWSMAVSASSIGDATARLVLGESPGRSIATPFPDVAGLRSEGEAQPPQMSMQ